MGNKSGVESGRSSKVPASAPVFSGNVSDEHALEYLVSVRAAERSRMAQQLHDRAFQVLAVLQLNFGRMKRRGPEEIEALIVECEELVSNIARELREVCEG
jgi:signal transduction histidine kinase